MRLGDALAAGRLRRQGVVGRALRLLPSTVVPHNTDNSDTCHCLRSV